MKEKREARGSEVRGRNLSEASIEAIELVKSHLEEKRYSIRTVQSYVSHLEFFFKYYHEKDPSKITRQKISEFVDDFIFQLGYSASYQNLIKSSIKMCYSLTKERRHS